MFTDVLSSASETNSELSHGDSELTDSDSEVNSPPHQLEETVKYVQADPHFDFDVPTVRVSF